MKIHYTKETFAENHANNPSKLLRFIATFCRQLVDGLGDTVYSGKKALIQCSARLLFPIWNLCQS